jgi:hypothetical protein
MHNQNFAPLIQNPNFDVHKNRPDSQLINETLEKVSRKLVNFYCLRGFLTSRPLRVRWQCFVTTIKSSLSSSNLTPTSITDSTSLSTTTSISASFELGRASLAARVSARVMNRRFGFSTAFLFFPCCSWAIYSSRPVICAFWMATFISKASNPIAILLYFCLVRRLRCLAISLTCRLVFGVSSECSWGELSVLNSSSSFSLSSWISRCARALY